MRAWGRGVCVVFCLIAVPPAGARADYQGPETCADCHSDVYESWKSSIHAKAFSADAFQTSWKENGRKPECLSCHTTGHKPGSLDYVHAGVSCESCHGPMAEGHADGSASMPVPASPDMCKSCHEKTHQEWKLSKHGEKNIRCFDCHNVHSQGLRAGGGDTLCGSCHSERLTDFAHSTHHLEGLECSSCHMPMFRGGGAHIEGTGAAGHTLAVGAEVCARCHEDTVHKSGMLPQLREKVTGINQQMSVAGVESVFDLNEKAKELEWKLARARQSAWVPAVLLFVAGLALGWLWAWAVYRMKRKKP